MGNNEKVVVLSFQFENDWLQSHGQIMVRLINNQTRIVGMISEMAYLCSGITMMVRVHFVLCNLFRIIQPDAVLCHFFTHSGIQLA